MATLTGDVRAGRWDTVVPSLARLRLPPTLLTDIYELIILELVEMRETDAARALARSSAVVARLRTDDPRRAARLDTLTTAGPTLDPDSIYGDAPRDARRAAAAASLAACVVSPPPARLLTLLGDALRWQRSTGALPPGATVDLVRGGVAGAAAAGGGDEEEVAPADCTRTIRFGARAHAEAATFTPDGLSLVTGSVDGFVEVWDVASGRLRGDLAYQVRVGGGSVWGLRQRGRERGYRSQVIVILTLFLPPSPP